MSSLGSATISIIARVTMNTERVASTACRERMQGRGTNYEASDLVNEIKTWRREFLNKINDLIGSAHRIEERLGENPVPWPIIFFGKHDSVVKMQ